MDRGAHTAHRVATSQIQLSSMQEVSNLLRKGKKKKTKPSFFKHAIPCPGELILQNPGGCGETPERWRRTCFLVKMQPEVGQEKPAEGEREGGGEEEGQGAGDGRGCPPAAWSGLCPTLPGPQTCPLPAWAGHASICASLHRRPCRGWAAGSSSCDPPPPCSQRPRPCWRRLFSSRLFEPHFSLSGSKDPCALTCRDLTLRQAGLCLRKTGSARGAGGRGQLSEDLEHHLENLPRG